MAWPLLRREGYLSFRAASTHLTPWYLAWLLLNYCAASLQPLLPPLPPLLAALGVWGFQDMSPAAMGGALLLQLLATLALAGVCDKAVHVTATTIGGLILNSWYSCF